MLPKLDLHGGRGAPDKDSLRANVSEAVVALPRLRLLRQVTSRDEQRVKHGHHFHSSPRSPLNSDSDVRRGRGMVRPVRDKGRSPSPMRQRRLPEEQNSYTPHHDAQQRVRQHMRQKRRKAKEEEELRVLEEKERQERMQKSMPQVEAYRRELVRKAAELHRREKAEKEIAAVEQEQLASARRERVNRYMRPDAINEHLRRFDNSAEMTHSAGEDRRPAGSSVRATRLDDEAKDVIVSGSFATGSVRARHKVLLSPRRQGGNVRSRGWDESVHEAQIDPNSFQGSEPAALDEGQEENWKTAVDASPTEVPSPTTGTTGTGQAPTESHGTLEAQQEATEASTSDLPKEESQIPQSTSGEAKGQFQASDENADGAVHAETATGKTEAPSAPGQEAKETVPSLSKEVEIPTGSPEQETVNPAES